MPRPLTRDQLLRRRFAIQRLSGPALPHVVEAVRLLTCVQSQDAPLAHWSLGMRTSTESYAAGLAEQAAGTFVRTHVLRPTWHFVAAEDLRWIQALTGPKVERTVAGYDKRIGLDPAVRDRIPEVLIEVLGGRTALTRREIAARFAERGLPSTGIPLGHLLMTAELRAVICSGPPRGSEHTYVLVNETIPPTELDTLPHRDRPAAVRELTHRFVTGHGPVGDRELGRWADLTLTEIRTALAELTDAGLLETIETGDGSTLWFDPSVTTRTSRAHAAYLMPTFDEATLTYPRDGTPRANAETDRSRLIAEAGGGTAVVDGLDIGVWKRKVVKGAVEVRVLPEIDLTVAQRHSLEKSAQRLGAFLGLDARLSFS